MILCFQGTCRSTIKFPRALIRPAVEHVGTFSAHSRASNFCCRQRSKRAIASAPEAIRRLALYWAIPPHCPRPPAIWPHPSRGGVHIHFSAKARCKATKRAMAASGPAAATLLRLLLRPAMDQLASASAAFVFRPTATSLLVVVKGVGGRSRKFKVAVVEVPRWPLTGLTAFRWLSGNKDMRDSPHADDMNRRDTYWRATIYILEKIHTLMAKLTFHAHSENSPLCVLFLSLTSGSSATYIHLPPEFPC